MTIARKVIGCTLATAGLVAGMATPSQADAKRPTPPQIEVVQYGGSGCPADTATIVPNLDGTGFTALYDAFEARTPANPSLKACTLVLNIKVPPGLKVGVRRVVYRGEAVLTRAGRSEFKAKYFYQGNSKTLEHPGWSRNGAYEGSWEAVHDIRESYFSWCGKDSRLNITQNLKTTGSGTNVMNMETADSSYSTKWDFDLQPC
ncbi:DUF4360 domain-containing protein [Pilimelia columellifera]|uniref:DUF4360 domain-containing protein n=1 Tax=Pilimelia columellifera subsp. columellifera TaxID=706583 RepID=A0ABN3N528_9ACTN